VSFGFVAPSEVSSVESGQSVVNISKVDVKPGTMGLAMAGSAKIAIAVGTCS
jgi:hypothetical protein